MIESLPFLLVTPPIPLVIVVLKICKVLLSFHIFISMPRNLSTDILNFPLTCSAELCDKNGHFWGSYHIYIFVFLTSLQIFVPHLERLFFINHYFIVCIFKYHSSSHIFSLIKTNNSGLDI